MMSNFMIQCLCDHFDQKDAGSQRKESRGRSMVSATRGDGPRDLLSKSGKVSFVETRLGVAAQFQNVCRQPPLRGALRELRNPDLPSVPPSFLPLPLHLRPLEFERRAPVSRGGWVGASV
jgi:hypothetical protein